jgi:hypothetical protein
MLETELNKFLGRDFLIGFLLPAFLFMIGVFEILSSFEIWVPMLEFDPGKPIETGAAFGAMTWIFAIFLQATNRELFRFAEGYSPKSWWEWCGCSGEKRRFRKISDRLRELREEFEACPEDHPFEKLDELQRYGDAGAVSFLPKKGSCCQRALETQCELTRITRALFMDLNRPMGGRVYRR